MGAARKWLGQTPFGDRRSTVEPGRNRRRASKNWRILFEPFGHQSGDGGQDVQIMLMPVYFFWAEMPGSFDPAWRGAPPSWAIVGS
jgi:hypothetical protein